MFNCNLKDLNRFDFVKAFVICDPFFVENKTIDLVTSNLSKIKNTKVYSKVKPDPTLNDVIDGVEICSIFDPDVIIALGGGSAIDLAKSIGYFSSKIIDKKPYFIAIPTTSGTGSEVTSFAVITDEENNVKLPLIDDKLLPDVAFLDNDLIKDLPPAMVAFTGMDALTHALEASVSIGASVFSDAYASKALNLIKDNIIDSYQNKNVEAKPLMHQASTLAGVAFNDAGLGINHAIAHQLGALFKIPHGKCNAILLPYVIELNASYDKTKAIYNQIAFDLHLTSSYSQLGYRSLINWVNKLKNSMKIENRLREVGITREDFNKNLDMVAEHALKDRCMDTNPVQLTKEEMIAFLKKVY